VHFYILSTEYDKSDDTYPKLVCVITGKGPLKSHYQRTILKLKWNKVSIIMPWLENKDYPLLLGKIAKNLRSAKNRESFVVLLNNFRVC